MVDQFLGAWKIKTWEKGSEVPEGIPGNGFKEGGPLNITQLDPNSIELVWLNGDDQPCLVTDLNFDQVNNQLEGQDLQVNFAGRLVPCDLTVELDSGTLTLTINAIEPTVNSGTRRRIRGSNRPDVGGGTVTATANPGGQ